MIFPFDYAAGRESRDAEVAKLRQKLADLLDWQQKAFAACPNIDTLIATNKVLGEDE